jgi:HK97 gp10 family phage protein
MADGLKIEMQLHGLTGVLETLKSLPAEVVSKRGGPVKSALRKGANVILKAEKMALALTLTDPNDETTGLLLKSLSARRGKPPPGMKGERYIVGPRRKSYPNRKGKRVTTGKTASLKEYGSQHQKAEPFIRPAFNAKAAEAIRTIETELLIGVEKAAAKLLLTNKGK